MEKKQANTYIDSNLYEKAKDKGIIISAVLEEALRLRLKPTITDINPNQILFKCSNCSAVVEYCYICPISKEIWCRECEISKKYCAHASFEPKEKDGSREHEHIRLPNLKGEFNKKLYHESQLEQYRGENIK